MLMQGPLTLVAFNKPYDRVVIGPFNGLSIHSGQLLDKDGETIAYLLGPTWLMKSHRSTQIAEVVAQRYSNLEIMQGTP
jgi:hypothetical protein